MTLMEKIEKAETLKEMNDLRMECVEALYTPSGPKIVKLWQNKYWEMKTCPNCGKIR